MIDTKDFVKKINEALRKAEKILSYELDKELKTDDYDKGFIDGLEYASLGYDDGYDDGFVDGIETSNDNYDKGYNEGYAKGSEIGYSLGFKIAKKIYAGKGE